MYQDPGKLCVRIQSAEGEPCTRIRGDKEEAFIRIQKGGEDGCIRFMFMRIQRAEQEQKDVSGYWSV